MALSTERRREFEPRLAIILSHGFILFGILCDLCRFRLALLWWLHRGLIFLLRLRLVFPPLLWPQPVSLLTLFRILIPLPLLSSLLPLRWAPRLSVPRFEELESPLFATSKLFPPLSFQLFWALQLSSPQSWVRERFSQLFFYLDDARDFHYFLNNSVDKLGLNFHDLFFNNDGDCFLNFNGFDNFLSGWNNLNLFDLNLPDFFGDEGGFDLGLNWNFFTDVEGNNFLCF